MIGRRLSTVALAPLLSLGLLLLGLVSGCTLAGPGAPWRPAPDAPPPPAGLLPWELPPSELGTQGLYRVSLSGPEESGSFRLTLLLQSPERYQVRTVDPLGRGLWTLDVEGEGGLWLDHRNRVACRLEGSFDLAVQHLAPFPLASLPALLLGRLPEPPAVGERLARRPPTPDARLDYRDARGRRWTARLEEGRPAAWTLWRDGSPVLWWVRQGDQIFLSDPERGHQLQWRRTVREPLAGDLEVQGVPEDYRQADCAALYG